MSEVLTGAEIKKALECCINSKCSECPLRAMNCSEKVAMAFANNLINRQKAEIERLKKRDETAEKIIREQADTILRLKDENSRLSKKCENSVVALIAAKAEAVKEFAERLKPLSRNLYPFSDEPIIDCKQIDNLVKEMVGEG